MSANKTQISPIPPEGYGDRFIKFISGITKPREESEAEARASAQTQPEMQQLDGTRSQSTSLPPDMHSPPREAIESRSNNRIARLSPDQVIEHAEYRARQSTSSEEEAPDRTLKTIRSSSVERGADRGTSTTLPVLEEVGEGGSMGGRSANSAATSRDHELEPNERGSRRDAPSHNDNDSREGSNLVPQNMLSPPLGGRPPPTPPKDVPTMDKDLPVLPMPDLPTSPLQGGINRQSWFTSS